jgi:S-formylglutathione hydrolase FrmB
MSRRAIPAIVAALLSAMCTAPAEHPGVEQHAVFGQSLVNNLLGDSPTRDVLVYLPRSYALEPARRYPVIYLLHSFGTGPRSWLGEDGYEGFNVAATLDSLAVVDPIHEMIVVMPDARNRYGGSWYARSAAIGDWETFIGSELVSYVDSAFRSIPAPEGRAIVGQSMGGYGALRIAMVTPDRFGAVVAMSSPHIANPNPIGEIAARAALAVSTPAAVLGGSALPGVLWSKAAAFSARTDRAPFYAELPYRWAPDSACSPAPCLERLSDVWAEWRNATILELLGRPEHQAALRRVRLRIAVGVDDPLRTESERLVSALTANGVANEFVRFPGGHVVGVGAELGGVVLPDLARYFARSRR